MNHHQLPYRDGNLIVIYDAHIIKKHQKTTNLQKKVGYLFLTLFFLGTTLLVWPVVAAKNSQPKIQIADSAITPKSPALQETNNFNLSIWLNQREIAFIPDKNFSLIIPKININAKVIPSIDLADKNTTQKALGEGVVQAKGSSFPGQQGTISIFGHSTNSPWNIKLYNAIFYSLKDLEKNNEIIIIYKGSPFIYQVEGKKIVGADDLQHLASPSGKEKLILFTCWPPGTTWKRLLIIAVRT